MRGGDHREVKARGVAASGEEEDGGTLLASSTTTTAAPQRRNKHSFRFALAALLLLSVAVFCGLLYASINLVVFAGDRRRGEHYYLPLPSFPRDVGDDDDDDDDDDKDLPAAAAAPSLHSAAASATTTTLKEDREPRQSGGGSAAAAAAAAAAAKVTKGRLGSTTRAESGHSLTSTTKTTTNSPYAYAFLLAGCDAARPEAYRPLLASVCVAIHLLRKYGSVQDAIVYVMMTTSDNEGKNNAEATNATKTRRRKPAATSQATLSAEELRVLDELNATVRQIPPVPSPTFHRIMLQKFRVLGLTQYRRVMFLDSDVLPLLNLDVFFELSDPAVIFPPVLRENLVFMDYVSPANGGTFMLAPHEGDLEKVNGMIREAQTIRNGGVEGREPWRLFKPDAWEAFDRTGTEYDFHAVSGDQGLLWSWVRHYQRQFSYVVKDGVVKNYVPDDEGADINGTSVRLESVIDDPFAPDHDEIWPVEVSVWGTRDEELRRRRAHPRPPGAVVRPHDAHMGAFGAMFHFLMAGGGKPWYREGCRDRWDAAQMPANGTGVAHSERARRFWCQTYHELSVVHNLSVPASSLHTLSAGGAAHYHPSIGPEMWATEGPVTDLLDPDFDPRQPSGKVKF